MYTVLVVEPNAALQELFDAQLSLAEYRIHTVASAEDALVCLTSIHVDLVLTELRLPDCDGTIFLQCMEQSRLRTMPVAAISTGLSIPPEFDAYIRKPYHLADLHKIIQTLLEGTNHATSPYTLLTPPLPERTGTPGAANR